MVNGENEAYKKTGGRDPDRLAFHLMPETGWMNDPNGLCQFKENTTFIISIPPLSQPEN